MLRQLPPAGRQALADLAHRHDFSPEAVAAMLEALDRGGGTMAQFDHPEFGGPGQWMQGGMVMVGDMFNQALKTRVDGLCRDLARLRAEAPDVLRSPAPPAAEWWPADLGRPDSTGSQDGLRYAYFAAPRRLAIENGGRVTVYDTLDHRISGFSQQQSGTAAALHVASQHGPVALGSLPVVSGGKARTVPR